MCSQKIIRSYLCHYFWMPVPLSCIIVVPGNSGLCFPSCSGVNCTDTLQGSLTLDAPLLSGQFLISIDGSKRAIYQPDGNFVLYGENGTVLWASKTYGIPKTFSMQLDGNLCVYTSSGNGWCAFCQSTSNRPFSVKM